MSDERSDDLLESFLVELSEEEAEAARPISHEEIARLDDPERLRSRVALRFLERYGWHQWPDAEMPDVQRCRLATDAFEAEWENGGLSQFVINQGDAGEKTLAWGGEGNGMLGVPTIAGGAARVFAIGQAYRDLP